MTVSLSNPLSLDDIRSTLATKRLGQQLHLHREVPSTNSAAMALGQSGAEDGTVVIADRQTAGRGRQARFWYSPGDTNLYCSVLIRPTEIQIPFGDWLSWIPLASAVAVTEAVRAVAGVRLALKWPNDLLLDEKKLGGILCENAHDQARQPFVVIGIGLNVNATPDSFPPELTAIAGSIIESSHRPVDRNRLLSRLLGDLESVLDELASEGARRLQHAYADRCATIGKRIRVMLTDSREVVGMARGIGRDGSLLLQPSSSRRQGSEHIMEVRAADVIHLRE